MEKTQSKSPTQFLWGEQAKLIWLLLATLLITTIMLGSRELWTQEGRWAAIIGEMLLRHDYWHPYIAGVPYYDKPLLSYWFSILLSYITGGFNEWSLRLPSVLASITIVYCTYYLGNKLINRSVGLLAGWMLISTYFFIFWSRVAGADMLNLAGILLALSWYFAHREKATFWNYLVFFAIIAISCLFKGILAAVVVVIALIPELLHEKTWEKHLRPSLFVAAIIGLLIYLIPFFISQYLHGQTYGDNGLFKVYRENVLRFFKPFDHKGPVYLYLYYLPLYTFPWIFLFIPAIWRSIKSWKQLQFGERWLAWVTLLLFIFFTASGSRRSYYILPVVPFAILMTANWVIATAQQYPWRARLTSYSIIIFYTLLFVWFGIIQPFTNNRQKGIWEFATAVQTTAVNIKPWSQWQIAILDTDPKPLFYLKLTQPAITISLAEAQQNNFIAMHPHTIIITSKNQLADLQPELSQYQVIMQQNDEWMDSKKDEKIVVALVPPN